jgi:hypothetical protein
MTSSAWQSCGVRNASNASLWVVVWRALAMWLPVAVATTGLAGIVYVTAQQSLRLGFDDPQIVLARRTGAPGRGRRASERCTGVGRPCNLSGRIRAGA